jgi:hypothetical protein
MLKKNPIDQLGKIFERAQSKRQRSEGVEGEQPNNSQSNRQIEKGKI